MPWLLRGTDGPAVLRSGLEQWGMGAPVAAWMPPLAGSSPPPQAGLGCSDGQKAPLLLLTTQHRNSVCPVTPRQPRLELLRASRLGWGSQASVGLRPPAPSVLWPECPREAPESPGLLVLAGQGGRGGQRSQGAPSPTLSLLQPPFPWVRRSEGWRSSRAHQASGDLARGHSEALPQGPQLPGMPSNALPVPRVA